MKDRSLYMFDLGNVLLNDIEVLDKIVVAYGVDKHILYTDYKKHEDILMTSELSTQEYIMRLNESYGYSLPLDVFKLMFTPTIDDKVRDIILQLRREGHTVVCASNTFADHWEVIEKMGVFEIFDTAYASHLMNLSKPDPLFYTTIIKNEDYCVENSIFIDDLEENILSAKALGIKAVWFIDDKKISKYQRLKTVLS